MLHFVIHVEEKNTFSSEMEKHFEYCKLFAMLILEVELVNCPAQHARRSTIVEVILDVWM